MALRLFFGLPVEGAACTALTAASDPVRLPPDWRRTPLRNWHLTLVFLGAADAAQLPALQTLGERACALHAPGAGRLDRLGWLPSARRPKLLAALAAAATPFLPLHQTLRQGALDLGFAIESRPLLPHVTLARRRKGAESAVDARVIPLPAEIVLPLAELVLYSSETGPDGQHYRPLWRAPLRGGGA